MQLFYKRFLETFDIFILGIVLVRQSNFNIIFYGRIELISTLLRCVHWA